MEEQERYLGAVGGSPLAKGILNGYALYATTKRIIGVKERRDAFLDQPDLVGLLYYRKKMEKHEKQLETEFKESFSGEAMKRILESKDLEIKKDEIRTIRLKKNGSVRPGHIRFQLKSGKEIEIRILSEANSHPGFFQKIGDLLQAFFPEALELEN
jgi:hypothetical protein